MYKKYSVMNRLRIVWSLFFVVIFMFLASPSSAEQDPPGECRDICTGQVCCWKKCTDMGERTTCGAGRWPCQTILPGHGCGEKCGESTPCTAWCREENNCTLTTCGAQGSCGDKLLDRSQADCVATNLGELEDCLSCNGAPCPSGWVVWVDNDIDVGTTRHIGLAPNMILASSRGSGQSPGATLFTDFEDDQPILRFTGDHSRITGLRVHGPWRNWDQFLCEFGLSPTNDPSRRTIGIQISGTTGNLIDHCEVKGFRGAGVAADSCGDTRILDNDIRMNRAEGGSGYGVVVGGDCVPMIAGNTFDCNRHAIAGSGAPGSGYRAFYNYAGKHNRDQQFDMHDWCYDHGYCDNPGAGDIIIIKENTFEDDNMKPAIWIRGRPRVWGSLDHNWFHGYESCTGGFLDPGAIWQTEGAGDWLHPGPDGGICIERESLCGGNRCDCQRAGYPLCSSLAPTHSNEKYDENDASEGFASMQAVPGTDTLLNE